MKKLLTATALPLLLVACGGNDIDDPSSDQIELSLDDAPTADGDAALGSEISTVAGTPYADTAWEWTAGDGTITTTTLRSDGSYQDTGGDEVRDQGTWSVDEQGRTCIDSNMEDDNDMCWDGPEQPVAVGESYVANSDTGFSLEMTRVDYRPIAKEAPE